MPKQMPFSKDEFLKRLDALIDDALRPPPPPPNLLFREELTKFVQQRRQRRGPFGRLPPGNGQRPPGL